MNIVLCGMMGVGKSSVGVRIAEMTGRMWYDTDVVITARHNSEKEDKGEGNYLRRERKYGSYSRSFNVSGINTEGIKAAYKSGILEITLPKQAEVSPAARTIQKAPVAASCWGQGGGGLVRGCGICPARLSRP